MSERKKEIKYSLNKGCELRFEVKANQVFKLKLVSGTCEIFGCSLAMNVSYTFMNVKLAVYTWHGCELTGEGDLEGDYISEETPMHTYLNLHLGLDNLRTESKKKKVMGPKLLVVGSKDCGKTSLSKILLNYALRQGWQPTYIDLDPSYGTVTLPGSVSATSLSAVIEPHTSFSDLAQKDKLIGWPQSLVYWYGYTNPNFHWKLYTSLIHQLHLHLEQRLKDDLELNSSGVFLDGFGISEDIAVEHYNLVIDTFQVDTVVVVGNEKLYNDLIRSTDQNKTLILKVAKSGGVVSNDTLTLKQHHMDTIQHYFYGLPHLQLPLNPSPTIVQYKDVHIFQIGQGQLAPSSALPVGMDRKLDLVRVTKVALDENLLHAILAVVDTNNQDETSLVQANTLGFVYVTEIDVEKQCLTLLLPCPGTLPKNTLIMGTFRWMET